MRYFCFSLLVIAAADVFLFASAIESLGGRLCNVFDDEVIVRELVNSVDATIFGFQDRIAAGAERFLIGNTKNGIRRGLLKFIVGTEIGSFPSDAIVECTEIRLFDEKSDEERRTVPVPTINLHRVTSDWKTTGKTNLQLSGVNGGLADTGDTTWRYSNYPLIAWRNQGGDFDETVLATKIEAGDLHWYGNTREVADVVQGWIDDASTNYGFILVSEVEGEDSMVPGSYSRYSGVESSPELIPRLIVTYTSPSQGKPHRNYNNYSNSSGNGNGPSLIGFIIGALVIAIVLVAVFFGMKFRSKHTSEKNTDTTGENTDVARNNAQIT